MTDFTNDEFEKLFNKSTEENDAIIDESEEDLEDQLDQLLNEEVEDDIKIDTPDEATEDEFAMVDDDVPGLSKNVYDEDEIPETKGGKKMSTQDEGLEVVTTTPMLRFPTKTQYGFLNVPITPAIMAKIDVVAKNAAKAERVLGEAFGTVKGVKKSHDDFDDDSDDDDFDEPEAVGISDNQKKSVVAKIKANYPDKDVDKVAKKKLGCTIDEMTKEEVDKAWKLWPYEKTKGGRKY